VVNDHSIPDKWNVSRIIDIVENIIDYRGRTPLKLGMEWGKGDIPALSARNVKMGRIDYEEETYYGSEDLYKRWMSNNCTKKDDIVITTEAPLGNVALIPDDSKYILSQRTILLHTIPTIVLNRYLYHYFVSKRFQNILAKHSTGSTAKGIQRKKFETLEIIYPPLPEQTAIADALSDADDLITSLDRLIAKKRDIKQAAMQELLTGKKRLPGFGTGKGYQNTDLGEIPEDWKIKVLGNIVEFLDGQRRPVKDKDRAKMNGEYPYYGASGIVDYVNDYLFDENLILLGEDGENILSRNSRLAFKVTGKVWVNNHAHVFKPHDDINIDFLTEYLETLDYTPYNTGTAQPKLNKKTCFDISVLVPNYEEQTTIANVLSDMDANIADLEEKRDKARMIKEGMMQELLTGRIRLV